MRSNLIAIDIDSIEAIEQDAKEPIEDKLYFLHIINRLTASNQTKRRKKHLNTLSVISEPLHLHHHNPWGNHFERITFDTRYLPADNFHSALSYYDIFHRVRVERIIFDTRYLATDNLHPTLSYYDVWHPRLQLGLCKESTILNQSETFVRVNFVNLNFQITVSFHKTDNVW